VKRAHEQDPVVGAGGPRRVKPKPNPPDPQPADPQPVLPPLPPPLRPLPPLPPLLRPPPPLPPLPRPLPSFLRVEKKSRSVWLGKVDLFNSAIVAINRDRDLDAFNVDVPVTHAAIRDKMAALNRLYDTGVADAELPSTGAVKSRLQRKREKKAEEDAAAVAAASAGAGQQVEEGEEACVGVGVMSE